MHLVFCIHHFGLPNESRVLYVLGRTFRWISKKCAAKIPSETKEVTHPWVSAPSIQERKVKRSFFGGENLYIYIPPFFLQAGSVGEKAIRYGKGIHYDLLKNGYVWGAWGLI